MARTFLDWEPKPLDRAAQALVEAIEAQPGAWWYVLPGKRAVRQFEEALVRHLPAHLEPPRGVSQGAWLEALRPSNQPVIDRREAIHAWAAVLRGLTSKECLLALGREAPAPDAAGAWWSLGQRARDLHAELCQADLGFSDLALALPGQAKRWGLWQTLRDRYVQSLQDAGIVDGMELGRSPLVGPEVRLAWIFVPTATVVERKALAAMADRVHSWVLAPASHADRFDAFGLLLPEAWSTETLPLSLDRWHVERGPKQQVDRVLALLREWSTVPRAGSPLAASDIQLGTPDSELKPHLVRGLERVGLQARDAAGRALAQSSAALLVSALAKVLPDFRFQDVARLFRHPDLEPVLSAAVPGQDLAACLDEHHRRHLPLHLRDVAPSDSKLTRWLAVLREQLGGLAEPGEKPLGEWVSAIRTFLGWVYGSRRFAPHLEEQRASQATLEEFSRVLSHWNSAASPWLPQVHAEHALGLLVGELAGRNLPPLGSGEENETLEMLGWRELLWDDAPALILTGFHEGALPEAYPEDVLLPPAARRALGLADAQARMVRDLYLLRCLLGVREVCHLVSGRISEAGDPLRPSRLAFFVPEDQVPSAMQHALGSDVTHHGEAMGELESQLWAEFWEFANNPQHASTLGIRAAHGEAVSIKVREGKSYAISLRASDGLSIRTLTNEN
ncbi:MAG TPA: hypothetical protein P5218_11410 [Planctomycetota bacterium]|nr:hypothetical protein [Planctomycetota bacterium]